MYVELFVKSLPLKNQYKGRQHNSKVTLQRAHTPLPRLPDTGALQRARTPLQRARTPLPPAPFPRLVASVA